MPLSAFFSAIDIAALVLFQVELSSATPKDKESDSVIVVDAANVATAGTEGDSDKVVDALPVTRNSRIWSQHKVLLAMWVHGSRTKSMMDLRGTRWVLLSLGTLS